MRLGPKILASTFLVGSLAVSLAQTAPISAASANKPKTIRLGQVSRGFERYIVRFSDRVKPSEIAAILAPLNQKQQGRERHRLSNVFEGAVVDLNPAGLKRLRESKHVVWVEPDASVRTMVTQDASTLWGLDRVDQTNLPLSGTYSYDRDGSAVTAYVVDTGILGTHSQFGARVRAGFDAFGGTSSDCNGHGTHVAGTIGGSTYGVAKDVSLVAVRVLGCDGSGSTSGVIAGIDWAVSDHKSGPAVLNMSLGGSLSASLNAAVNRAVADGISVVVAAGNSTLDACTTSPASAVAAITVAASTKTDASASYTNYGTCVDLFAPGSGILSAYYTSNTSSATLSGTSMASPHVAGVVARYLELNPLASPETVANALVAGSTKNVITNAAAGTPNRLVNAAFTDAAPSTTTTVAPTTSLGTTTTVAPTTSLGTTTTTALPRVAPGIPIDVVARLDARIRTVNLSWTDDPVTKASLTGHVITVYESGRVVAVLTNGPRGEAAQIRVKHRNVASVTLTFTVSARNKVGISDPSAMSNSVIVVMRQGFNGNSMSDYFF